MKNLRFFGIVMVACAIAVAAACPAWTADGSSEQKTADEEVTVYLKSGEVIKGTIESKTDDEVVIKKYGQSLSIKIDDVARITGGPSSKTPYVLKKLPFSTAIITYECKGLQNGKEVAYIDAANNKVAIEDSLQTGEGEFIIKENTRTIFDGSISYRIDLDKRKATSIKVEGDPISSWFGEQLYMGMATRKTSFLGKECNLYEKNGSSLIFWNGILLKEQIANPMGEKYNIAKEAVDIKLDIPISQDKFMVPADMPVKTLEEDLKDLSKGLEEITEKAGKMAEEFKSERIEASARACQATLKSIYYAKQVWSMDRAGSPAKDPAWEDLVPKYIHEKPKCLSGGTYILGSMNELPTCSINEHNPGPSEWKELDKNRI